MIAAGYRPATSLQNFFPVCWLTGYTFLCHDDESLLRGRSETRRSVGQCYSVNGASDGAYDKLEQWMVQLIALPPCATGDPTAFALSTSSPKNASQWCSHPYPQNAGLSTTDGKFRMRGDSSVPWRNRRHTGFNLSVVHLSFYWPRTENIVGHAACGDRVPGYSCKSLNHLQRPSRHSNHCNPSDKRNSYIQSNLSAVLI